MSWHRYESCILKESQDQVILEDGVDVELEGSCGPQVRATADFSTGMVKVTQLNDQCTSFPERGNLVLETVDDYCFLKHEEQIIMSKSRKYKVEFPPRKFDMQKESEAQTFRNLKRKKNSPHRPTKKMMFGTAHSDSLSDEAAGEATKTDTSEEDCEKSAIGVSEARCDPLEGSWIDNEDLKVLYFKPNGDFRSTKCACFDMDQTLIKTQSGKKFPVNKDDWQIIYNSTVPKRLKELYNDNYRLVVFSNQRGLATGKESKSNLKEKFTSIMKRLKVPMTMFLSYGLGVYRKPSVGLWNLLEEENGSVDKGTSFYVGDAAGRPKDWQPGASRDHSKVDRLFALNVNITFHTPEEFFLNSRKNKFEMPAFDPKSLRNNRTWGVVHKPTSEQKEFTSLSDLISPSPEMILFVGFPASGKSTLAKQMVDLKGYVHINQDSLGSLDRCLKKAKEEIHAGKSVIIDNTNFARAQRKKFLEIVETSSISARCFWFDCPLDQIRHNNKFRLLTAPDAKHKDITDIVIHSLRKKFEEPDLKEGFKEIVKVKMVPCFNSPQREELYYMFLLEN